MSSADAFYRQRDQRSLECGALVEALAKPVAVLVGDDAVATVTGQVALLALANLLPRVHRDVTFVMGTPEARLLANSISGGSSLGDAVLRTARTIDPYGSFKVAATRAQDMHVTIALGNVSEPASAYVGVVGADAVLRRSKVSINAACHSLAVLAGGLAACLGAAAVFRAAHGDIYMPELRVSAWSLEQVADLNAPATLPANVPATIEVGDVVLVGAGAVAAAFAYWVSQIGHLGLWSVVDADLVKLHNTNRGMLFFPTHAGWLDDKLDESRASPKASIVADALGATWTPQWYHEWISGPQQPYDLILPLANEHGVRHAIASLHEPLLIHASTSQSGASQLHRHIPGRDDCLDCRLPEKKVVQFGCSTSTVKAEDGTSTDAALPFLSAAAGLMLAAALLRLQAGELVASELNFWDWNFLTKRGFASAAHSPCNDACVALPDKAVRATLSAGKRWRTE